MWRTLPYVHADASGDRHVYACSQRSVHDTHVGAAVSQPSKSFDLHAHTTASDGDLAPARLVAHAAAAGVTTLAITDHDTLAGVPEARTAGAASGVRVVCGIELTVRVPMGSMHLLGYFPTESPAPLVDRLDEFRDRRDARIREIIARLAALGMPLTWDDVRRQGAHQLGRPHVADALVAAGHVADRDEAFARWLGDGLPAAVPSDGLDPEEAVRLVRASGGVSVLAHPGSLSLPHRHLTSFVQRLGAYGLTGIEVHRPEHLPEQRDHYAEIARRLHLLPCGGSDFHRPESPYDVGDTGTPGLAGSVVEDLLARIS